MALPYRPVVKGGKFYHVYGDGSNASDWRYIRPAGSATANSKPSATTGALQGGPAAPVIGPPPDPFLTPDDLASQAVEQADWDRYFSGIENSTNQMEIETNAALAQNEVQHGRNLEANDWNQAARGLGNSSIKQNAKAALVGDFTRTQGAARDRLATQKAYTKEERRRYDTDVLPKLVARWNAKAAANATAASAAQAEAAGDSQGGSTPATSSTRGAAAAGYRNVVKNGKFYHVYGLGDKASDWRYIRPASG